ncbi:MAG: peptidoglycan editing factor PgeF [Zoogloea sp.]|uniref:peptidoglycan editing factor PgeF n=1 Tax=Zoogloea sp. TaxID=49181 RepID=UPI00262911B6|nr:peptidoglycan editing factor PgeF [Zoogloea sp.]MDD2989177.1 peptidoglycan editing factor PgeF [Zoogloea sp.]
MNDSWIHPDWPAPARVRALSTTRAGGLGTAPYNTLNLGTHVGDDPARVAANRAILRQALPAEPCWLNQVHGVNVVEAGVGEGVPDADASVSRQSGRVCAVMTADCLPVLLCDRAGSVVAAAHAGWRGLHGGVIEATVAAMNVSPGQLLAWLGPAIGPDAFEVGGEVRAAFMGADPASEAAFRPSSNRYKWLADIYLLARQRLARAGVTRIYGGDACTVTDAARFFSYRRDGVTGRMASLIWLD